MKDQYFGDLNDYLKYGLLRQLALTTGLPVAMCWLLTSNDNGSDGLRTHYLRQPECYRDFDSDLFDLLGAALIAKRRAIGEAERLGLIPGAWYYNKPLGDDIAARKAYFDGFARAAPLRALVFFDPDNGLEVASVSRRQRRSTKHLYFDELARSAGSGSALMLYQHFPRCDRSAYLDSQAERIQAVVPGECVAAVSTSSVAFFLVARGNLSAGLIEGAEIATTRWENTVTRQGGTACTLTRFATARTGQ